MELNQGMHYSYFVFAKKLNKNIIQKTTTLTLSIHFSYNWNM